MFVILFTQQEPVYPEMLQLQKKEKKRKRMLKPSKTESIKSHEESFQAVSNPGVCQVKTFQNQNFR